MHLKLEQNIKYCSLFYGLKASLELGFRDGEKDKISGAITKNFPIDNLQVILDGDSIKMVASPLFKGLKLKYEMIFTQNAATITYCNKRLYKDNWDIQACFEINKNTIVSSALQCETMKRGALNEAVQEVILEYVADLLSFIVSSTYNFKNTKPRFFKELVLNEGEMGPLLTSGHPSHDR